MEKLRFARRRVLVSSILALSFLLGLSAARAEEGGGTSDEGHSMMMKGMRHGGMGPGMRMMGGACAKDMQTYCSDKKGKDLHECMTANESKLSAECKEFHSVQKQRHEEMMKQRDEVLAACKADIESSCKNDKIPMRCLHQKYKADASKLSAACSTKMKESETKMKEMREKMRAMRKERKDGAKSAASTEHATH